MSAWEFRWMSDEREFAWQRQSLFSDQPQRFGVEPCLAFGGAQFTDQIEFRKGFRHVEFKRDVRPIVVAHQLLREPAEVDPQAGAGTRVPWIGDDPLRFGFAFQTIPASLQNNFRSPGSAAAALGRAEEENDFAAPVSGLGKDRIAKIGFGFPASQMRDAGAVKLQSFVGQFKLLLDATGALHNPV